MHPFQYSPRRQLTTLKGMTKQRWIMLAICMALVPPLVYVFSPYWAAHQVLKALQTQDIQALKHKIPKKLLTHLMLDTHPDRKWQGTGGNYLKHVWPKLYQGIDPEMWLSLHVQGLAAQDIHHYYQHYFNQYALDLGSNYNSSHDQIRIEFERTSFTHWQIKRVCYPNPQPELVINRCPSSKR